MTKFLSYPLIVIILLMLIITPIVIVGSKLMIEGFKPTFGFYGSLFVVVILWFMVLVVVYDGGFTNNGKV